MMGLSDNFRPYGRRKGRRKLRKLWNSLPVRFVRDVAEIYFDKHVSRSAAELAYFLILTFFPVLICIHAFIGILHLDPDTVLQAAAAFVPSESLGILGDYIGYVNANQSSALLAAGASMTLFSAAAALRALMNVMDDIFGHGRVVGLRRTAASLVFSLLLLVTIYLSVVVLVTGGWFFHMLQDRLGLVLPMGDWRWMRFLMLFSLVLLFVLVIYRMSVPDIRRSPPVFPGAVLASGAMVAFSILFSWFIGMSSRYSLVYGSLASVIILLVWLYLCGNILILGNVFNCVLHQYRRKRTGR
ncbi:hypothetical protein SDC9_81814 [bioreactor metagenome]|uniref:Uncharacterized protein n=1 Tax=bioreactor metagenome TaxID=1076179 RepID=A0A644ZBF5_9ZZZZ